MTNKEAIELQTRLDEIALYAEDVAALAHAQNPVTAQKFRRFAAYARNISTCVRLHGQIPTEKELPPALRLAKDIHRLSTMLPGMTETIRRGVR
jgi:hypothetical protein